MAAIELGIPYYIYNPSGSAYVALNAPSDANFVGYVSDITGLDSPGVRENAQVVVAGDGGYHGPFWMDRRPWTISGFVMPSFSLYSRDQAQEKLEGIVMQCLRGDGQMKWTPADGIQRFLPFRVQQPPRVTTGQSKVQKNFQIACVTADYRILAATMSSGSGTGTIPIVTVVNQGNADAAPVLTINGPITNPTIFNVTTGKKITIPTTVIPAVGTYPAGTLYVDLTSQYPNVNNQGSDYYGSVDPLNTDWDISVAGTLSVPGGSNSFAVTGVGTTSATGLQVQWRHSWV